MKPVIQSKLVFTNAILTVIAILSLLTATEGLVPVEWLKWIAFGIGALNIVLRVWFTEGKLVGFLKSK